MSSSAGSAANHASTQLVDDGAGAGNSTDSNTLNAPPKCWGCQKPIDGGSAIQFADGVWHIECFQCTTCGKVIEFDSNLLFLADGKPICPECSYCCSLCKKPIFDEAIVTVEGTYHSECFRCTNCKQRIQGKSFAKTSQGIIYCVGCYAERRERKKAARRRREHHVIEEKMLPSLPAEATASVSPSSKRAPEQSPSSGPTPTSSAADESPARPPPPPQQQQQQQQPQQSLMTRRRGMRNSADFTSASSGLEPAQPDATSSQTSQALKQLPPPTSSAFAASAPVSPLNAKSKEASKPNADDNPQQQKQNEKPSSLAPKSPPTLDVPLSTDLGIEAGLAWTEDIGALEENFVRFSMRVPSGSKPSENNGGNSQPPPTLSPSRKKHQSQDSDAAQAPSLGRSVSVKRYQKSRNHHLHPSQQQQQSRNRSASTVSTLGNFVPPGLRSSRDQTPANERDSKQQEDGKEWLSNASVKQLKEELLVNYGQLCRMEASYQKLRDLYASVIDQLLETRDTLQQERGKRIEFENILRNYYGYVPSDSHDNSQQQMKSSTSSTGGSNAPGGSNRHRVAGSSSNSNTTATTTTTTTTTKQQQQQQSARSGHSQGGMLRQPSLRRQRQIRKPQPQQEAAANDHNNDSGSDAEDAIITTVPQKATKRFIWPFGGSSHSDSHHGTPGSTANGAGGGGGVGSGGSGKNSEDHGSVAQHSFHMTSTFRAGKCDHCQERFKTFTNSVVRCRTCGFVCHQKCISEVTASCSGSASHQHHDQQHQQGTGKGVADPMAYDPSVPFQVHKMFGRDLVEQATIENRSVPWVVQAAVSFIEAEGINMEGVYRRSGSTMEIREVQMQIAKVAQLTNNKFDDPLSAHRIADADMDVASVTSVLKQYFRDLPNPLMTSATYNLWVQAANVNPPEERIKVYRTIADSMPEAHAQTLRFMMTHLKRIADNQKENKMTTNNLSVVFAPNILHMGKGDMLLEMANMSNINKTVSFVIQHADEIWSDTHYEAYETSDGYQQQQQQQQQDGMDYINERDALGGDNTAENGGSAEQPIDAAVGGGAFEAPKLGPLPFMVPPMRRQRGGDFGGRSSGRVSDTGGDFGASVAGVLSSPSSPVHMHYPVNSGAHGLDADASGAKSDDVDDGMALSQSMPSPKGMFLNAGPFDHHKQQQQQQKSGHNGGGGLLVYSQQQTGYGNNSTAGGGGNSNIHSRGSFDIPRK
ncbi:Rho-type gtpase-activating protein [Coemansia sp. RSA 986]|nr:Rho-type gtpase-activating protein [Coemansia sp. RSA 986]